MSEILEEYYNNKICFKCSKRQSPNRKICLRKNCGGLLRYRKRSRKK